MIYADIQCHGDEVLSLPLLNWLDHESFMFRVAVDTTLDAPTVELQRQVNSLKYSKGILEKSNPASWGGISIVKNILAALDSALVHPGWEYFATLSGACFPLKPPGKMLDYLDARRRDNNKKVFMSSVSPGFNRAIQSPISIDACASDVVSSTAYLGRAKISCNKTISSLIRENLFRPIQNIKHRQCAQFLEESKNHFIVRPMDMEAKSRLFDLNMHYGHMYGRQWVVLHREVVEWLVESGTAKTVSELLARTFIPDESFFQRCLAGPHSPFFGNIQQSCWMNGGGSKKITKNDLEARGAMPGKLFARKMDPSVVQCVNRMCYA